MGRVMLRALKATLVALTALIIVPIAVNVGSAGVAPTWLKPYVGWLWPVAGVCLVFLVGLEIWDKARSDRPEMSSRYPQDPRNLDLALTQVSVYIEARRRMALADGVRIGLAMDERPAVVRQPTHLVERVSGEEFQLSEQVSIASVFEAMNESMLILGAPGAGKTTLLLDLAAELVQRSRAVQSTTSSQAPIPIFVDLADLPRRGRRRDRDRGQPVEQGGKTDRSRDFDRRLVAALRRQYRIPGTIAKTWLEEDRFILLLDGLDEVPTMTARGALRG